MNVYSIFFLTFFIIRSIFTIVCDPICGTPVNDPFGIERGIKPGRVSWSHEPKSTSWNGKTSFFWTNENTNFEIVEEMLKKVIISQTNSDNVQGAWKEIFEYFNYVKKGLKNKGYEKGEKIAIKFNMNTDWKYEAQNTNQVTPQFIKALLRQLVNEYGVNEEDITFYDAARCVPEFYIYPPQGIQEEFPKVNFRDNFGGMSYVEVIEVDENSKIVFSSSKVPGQNITKLPSVVTEATYVIELNNFRAHSMAGLTATGKNWFGSVWVPLKGMECDKFMYWCPLSLHDFANASLMEMGTYNVLVDLMGHKDLTEKAVIILVDGLYGGIHQGQIEPARFQSTPFNNHWSSSIFASIDPIAIDSVLYDILRNEPIMYYAREGCVDNFLHEGALADNPPSGTIYNPDGIPGERLSSLGVHEHWNNPTDKQYSRNLGKNKGIELKIVN